VTAPPVGVWELFASPTSRVASRSDTPTPAPCWVRKRRSAVQIRLATPSAKLTVIPQRGNLICPFSPGAAGPKIAETSRTDIPRRMPPIATPGVINVEVIAPAADTAPDGMNVSRLGTSSSETNTNHRRLWRTLGGVVRRICPGPFSPFVDIDLDPFPTRARQPGESR